MNRFYEYVGKDAEMKKLYGDVSKRKDNSNSYVSFSLGLGNDCRLDVIHRTKTETIIVQIWCKTDRYYPQLFDHKDDIAKALSHLEGSISWDEKEEPKASRKAEVKRKCSGNEDEDFKWVVAWAKALYPVVRNVLVPDK